MLVPISIRRAGKRMLAAAGMAALSAGLASAPLQAQEISKPERILFLSNHFDSIKKPTKLNYTYRQEAAQPDSFTDEVSVDILKRHDDGTASVAAHFLTGTHEITIPPIDHAQGNPAILGFLERDIAEMKRLTGGATAYFRKRIRLALAAPNVPVKTVQVPFEGRQVEAQQITIHPYVDDPLKDRFGKYGEKGYVFVISDAVPGSVYQVFTTLNKDPAAPVIEATLSIAQAGKTGMKSTGLVAQQR